MTKKIRIGVSAMVAFALMFTTSFNVVAQEKVVASDNVEVRESVEAKTLNETVQKLKTKWIEQHTSPKTDRIGGVKEGSFQAPYYYTGPATTDIEVLQNLDNWSETPDDDNFECAGSAQVPCSILATSETDLNNKLQNCDDLQEVMTASTGSRADL